MFTRDQKIAALRREIALRQAVFPGRVRIGKMKQADADREIAVMEAILADYEPSRSEKAVA